MLDYCVRIHRQFPDKELRQFVIYLKPSKAESVYQNTFELPRTRHEFDVIRLWEQPAEIFLSDTGLLPFASLANTEDREALLRQVATQISQIANVKLQGNISTSTGILSALVLDEELVNTILGRNIMQDSALYRSILSEGREEGREEGQREMLVELLAMKLGRVPEATLAKVQQISRSHLLELKSALFSFETLADLESWIQART